MFGDIKGLSVTEEEGEDKEESQQLLRPVIDKSKFTKT